MLKVLTNENKGIKTEKLSRYIFIKMICIEIIRKTCLTIQKVNKLFECNSEAYLKPCQISKIDQDGAFYKNWLQLFC